MAAAAEAAAAAAAGAKATAQRAWFADRRSVRAGERLRLIAAQLDKDGRLLFEVEALDGTRRGWLYSRYLNDAESVALVPRTLTNLIVGQHRTNLRK